MMVVRAPVGRYFYTLLLFIAGCGAAQFWRDEILS